MSLQTGSALPPQQPWQSGGIEVVPCSEHIGAEIRGVDLSNLSEEAFEVIHDAWIKHLVLLFRDQDLTDGDLTEFSARFGELDEAPLDQNGRPAVPDYPMIAVISNVVEDGKLIGALGNSEAKWHADMSYNPVPPKGSALYALEVPPSGGDTGFLNCYAAYESLPDELKARIEGLSLKHDATLNSTGEQRTHLPEVSDVTTSPGAVHPAYHIHPESGRKAIYLGRRQHGYVMGLDVAESEELLDALWSHTLQDKFTWHHQWRQGDIVLWDNRAAMHRRDSFDASHRRIMHRTQIKGSVPTR